MKKILLAGFLVTTTLSLKAQQDVGALLNAGLDDGKKLTHAYLRPYGEVLGTALNAGWYTSASPHHVLGFDVTLLGSYISIPSTAESFDIYSLGLTEFKVASGSKSNSPTLSGEFPDKDLPVLEPVVLGEQGEYAQFTMPNGAGLNYAVAPMIQGAVGLPFNTEVILRFLPEQKLRDYGTVGLWGVGVKHSLKEYLPFVKRVPFWDMSVLAAYTSFGSNVGVNDVENVLTSGQLDVTSSAYTFRLLAGVNLPIISFFAGAGYGTADSQYKISGAYLNKPVGDVLTLDYVSEGFDFNLGTRVRLGIFALSADYTVGDYNMITVGAGISFR